jgi:hypothetical protein
MGQFQTELAAYRKALLTEDAPNGPERQLLTDILDRWRDHADAEPAWDKIVQACREANSEPPPPAFFVAAILQTRRQSWQVQQRLSQADDLVSAGREQAEQDWKADRITEAYVKKTAVKRYVEKADAMLGRQKAGAPRKLFIRWLNEMMVQNCGKPLHSVVATIVEITYGGDADVDTVRDALKPTTRGGRRRDTQRQNLR